MRVSWLFSFLSVTSFLIILGLIVLPGFVVSDMACVPEPEENHCCPEGFEYDKTYRCCLPEEDAVRLVEMYDRTPLIISREGLDEACAFVGYCEEKIVELGKKCGQGEGYCRVEDRQGNEINECEGGLECKQSVNSLGEYETACCKPEEEWNGKTCIPVETTTPWLATWTRSGGDEASGGGNIVINTAMGAMIPNVSESWGLQTTCPTGSYSCDDVRFDKVTKSNYEGCFNEHCFYCDAAMRYRMPPSPIWFEARNIGDNYLLEDATDYELVCNGPFYGVDGAVRPFNALRGYQAYLNCIEGDCNCGRDMDGSGDRSNGVVSGGGICNTLPQTSCIRGTTGTSPHECNRITRGFGFTNRWPEGVNEEDVPGKITIGVPVNPYDVSADDIIPEACGRLTRKEVVSYPHYPGQFPDGTLDYEINRYDKNHGELGVANIGGISTTNILPSLPDPYTVLSEDFRAYSLSGNTRYLTIDVSYTVEDTITRKPIVKQCAWVGCSRLEEDVISYERTSCYETCTGVWSCTTSSHPDGPMDSAPSCCGNKTSIIDYPCKGTYTATCGEVKRTLKTRTQDDCMCQYFCWGCWHFEGLTDDYPVWDDETDSEAIETITDTSKVTSAPYGENLRVEGPITSGSSETRVDVTGRVVYDFPGAPRWSMSYFNIKAQDAESLSTGSTPIDMLGGVRLRMNNTLVLDLVAKQYATLHDLTSLESTLPSDYIIIQNYPELDYRVVPVGHELPQLILNLSRNCTYWDDVSSDVKTKGLGGSAVYLRWLRNPAKKYLYYSDMFTGQGTRYSWNYPLMVVDASDPECTQTFYDMVYNIGLYRTFHEDEPRYYDFESLYMQPENVESNKEYKNYDPTLLSNLGQIGYQIQKPAYSVYARYAPNCGHEYYNSHSGEMCNDAIAYKSGGDCEYKSAFESRYPISSEDCEGVENWRMSDRIKCEGVPGKYKSYCAGGNFYAYWLDTFQYRYKWAGDHCEVEYVDVCDAVKMPANSYTIIFEPAATLESMDWSNLEMEVYTGLRSVKFKPVGELSPCDEQNHVINQGGLHVNVEKPKPVEYKFESEMSGDNEVSIKLVEVDLCEGS